MAWFGNHSCDLCLVAGGALWCDVDSRSHGLVDGDWCLLLAFGCRLSNATARAATIAGAGTSA